MLRIIRDMMVLISFFILLGCSYATVKTNDISQSNFIAKLAQGENTVILDVRSVEEFNEGHIPGAINIPNSELKDRITELEEKKLQDLVVYCRSGNRAAFSYQILTENDFEQVEHLVGDFILWEEKNLPIERITAM